MTPFAYIFGASVLFHKPIFGHIAFTGHYSKQLRISAAIVWSD